MNVKTKLTILQQLNERHTNASGIAKGFTLVELMIVVAVLGILSAVAVPQYLQARNAAEAGAAIGQALGLAKECATSVATRGIGGVPTYPPSLGTSASCSTSGGQFIADWTGVVDNLNCLNATFNGGSATINVGSDASIACVTGT